MFALEGTKIEENLAEYRVNEADRRYKLAWTRYHTLLGAVFVSFLSSFSL